MRWIALHDSYGWLRRRWRTGQISPDTIETPPESKILGPLFEPLASGQSHIAPPRTAERPGVDDIGMRQAPPNYPGMYKPPVQKPEPKPESVQPETEARPAPKAKPEIKNSKGGKRK